MKFFRSVTITFLTNIILFLIAFANTTITSRFLGTSGKGVVGVSSTVVNFSIILLGFGFASANVYYIGRMKKDIGSVIGNNIMVALCSIAALIPFYFLNLKYHFSILNNVSNLVLIYTLVMVPPFIMKSAFSNVLLGLKEIKLYNIMNVLDSSLNILLLIIFLLISRQPSSAVLASMIESTILCIIEMYVFTKKLAIKIKVDLKLVREMYNYGMKAQIGNLVQMINYQLDVFVVNAYCSTSLVGIYTLAVYIGQTLWKITGSVSTIIFPMAASSTDEKEMYRFSNMVTRITFTLILILSLLMALLSRPVIIFVFGSSFAYASVSLLLLLPGISIFSISNILAQHLAGTGKVKYNMISSMISAVITVILDFTLIPRMDIIGASITSSLSYITFTIMTLIFYMRESGSKLSDIIIMKKEDYLMIKDAYNKKLKGHEI